MHHDVIIIGGGPAGVSCALELHDSQIDYVLLEMGSRLGGQLLSTPNTIKNLITGFYDSGEQVCNEMTALVSRLGCNVILNAEVRSCQLQKKNVDMATTQLTGSAILLATGIRRRKLTASGAAEFHQDIAYSITGRSDLKGLTAAVCGGGDSALLDAIELSTDCPQVYLIHRGDNFRARPDIVERLHAASNIEIISNTKIQSVEGVNGHLKSLVLASSPHNAHEGAAESRRLAVDKLVVQIGSQPNNEAFSGQVNELSDGFVIIDDQCRTSEPGVFAAGDLTHHKYWRIAPAAGQGVIAATAIRKYLADTASG